MAGKTPGPVPNAVKRRRNKDENLPVVAGTRRGVTVQNIQPHPEWRQDVRNFFNAAMNSGQSDWYENSDVMMLYLMSDMLDKTLRGARTVPVYREERNSEGNWIAVLDDEGNPIPEMDEFGEPMRRTIGSLNGQALRSILDLQSSLLLTEGERRRLRLDLGMPGEDEEDHAAKIVEAQKKSVGKVTPITKKKEA